MDLFNYKCLFFKDYINRNGFIHDLFSSGTIEQFKFLAFECQLTPSKLLPSNTKKTHLHYAVLYNRLDLLKYFVSIDNKVYKQDFDGLTILHYAVLENNMDICCYLLKNYPELNTIQDYENRLPIKYTNNLELQTILKYN